jgi:DNA invertase Pin-like site-specific DNA recombinase
MGSELVNPNHLNRKAIVYIRQSTPHQVVSNQESLRLQYALCQRARELGWHEADIDVIDADLGLSGATASHRQGFKDLVARVTLGEIGIVLSIEVTRLARNCSDWYPLLDVCGHRSCLIADRDGIYDPGTPNGRLLLGLKGTISELELHTIRGRLTAGLLAKAGRGELALQLPTGLIRDPSGVVTKDPNREVQERIALLFESFLSVRTAVKVTRTLISRGLTLPRRDRHGEVCWRRPTIPAVTDMLKNPAYAGAFVYGRTRQQPSSLPGGRPLKSPRPAMDWRIVVKDKYPAYISWDTFEKIQTMCAITEPSICASRAAASRATARRCCMASPGAASAVTKWWCATKAEASTYAITCVSSTMSLFVSACGRRRSMPSLLKLSSKRYRQQRSMRYRGHARHSARRTRHCDTPKSSRFNGYAIRLLSPSVSSTALIRTTGSSPASSSGDGRRLSSNCGARKKHWRDGRSPRPANLSALIRAYGRRSWLSVSGSPDSGRVRRPVESTVRRCCVA